MSKSIYKRNFLENFVYYIMTAILAGMLIGLGGFAYLSTDNKIFGSILFSIGLNAICIENLHLYTGQIGYLCDDLYNDGLSCIYKFVIIWIGNFLGAVAMGSIVQLIAEYSKDFQFVVDKAVILCYTKNEYPYGLLIFLGLICGIFVFLAVDCNRKTLSSWMLTICVSAFIICGAEHCIADMFYYSVANMLDGNAICRILAVTLGNTLGCMLVKAYKLPNEILSGKFGKWRDM